LAGEFDGGVWLLRLLVGYVDLRRGCGEGMIPMGLVGMIPMGLVGMAEWEAENALIEFGFDGRGTWMRGWRVGGGGRRVGWMFWGFCGEEEVRKLCWISFCR